MSATLLDEALVTTLADAGAPVLGIAPLVRHRADGFAAADALASANGLLGAHPVALLAGPEHHLVARVVDGGGLMDAEGTVVDPDGRWYELRAFGAGGELRWRRPIAGAPVAVTLSESEGRVPTGPWESLGAPCQTLMLERRQLLWGEATGPATGGWLGLAEARVGSLRMPVGQAGEGNRVQLVSYEYVALGEDGNGAILDERLVGLVGARREQGGEMSR